MSNTTIEKWLEIYTWQKQNRTVNMLRAGADAGKLARIEELTGEKLPEPFKALYQAYDGENEGDDEATFFHLGFMSLDEIISDLENAIKQMKPANRYIADPEASKKLTDQVVEFLMHQAGTGWDKLEFSCSAGGSYGGPYLYKPNEKHRSVLKLTNRDKISGMARSLHELEKEHYNWDEMEFSIFPDGKYKIERTDYNFAENTRSFPEGAVKQKYFHHKWIPVFKDHGGNFIGVDLDPDTKGKHGQVIIFGRDENPQFVVAENLDAFFDLFLDRIKAHKGTPEELVFNGDSHLHEVLKILVMAV